MVELPLHRLRSAIEAALAPHRPRTLAALRELASLSLPPEVKRTEIEVVVEPLHQSYYVPVRFIDENGDEILDNVEEPYGFRYSELLDLEVPINPDVLSEIRRTQPNVDLYYFGGDVVRDWIWRVWKDAGLGTALPISLGVNEADVVVDLRMDALIPAAGT